MSSDQQKPSINFALLTVSDGCYGGEREDVSGAVLRDAVQASQPFAASVRAHAVLPDETGLISEKLKEWCDWEGVDVVVTTGGTGLHARDVTPEASTAVYDRVCPGIVHALTARSLQAVPTAALSRLTAGVRGKTLVVNLPGSHKAVRECWEVLEPILKHAVQHLREDRGPTDAEHRAMQGVPKATRKPKSSVKTTSVASRSRQSPWPLLSVAEALGKVMEEAAELGETEDCPLMRCLGRVSAVEVVAAEAHPPFAASIKDGYAVLCADGAGERRVAAALAAAHQPHLPTLTSGSVARISTGAPLPPGADAVVQVEDTELVEEAGGEEVRVEIKVAPSKVGQDVRAPGSDIARGQLLLPKGSTIGPAEIGVLASQGLRSLCVRKKPVVAVLSTGNEVADSAATQLRIGEIRDSNRPALLAALQERGYATYDAGIALDEPEVLLEAVVRSLGRADVLVTSGGVSMGERDLLKDVLTTDLAFTVHFGRVLMKPGKPTAFATGTLGGRRKLVFGLPGNPVSTFVTSNLYVFPALARMEGRVPHDSPTIAVLTHNDVKLDPRPEYHRAVAVGREPGSGLPLAASTEANQMSSRLTNSQGATLLLKLPPRGEGKDLLPKGSRVDAIIINGRI